MHSSTAGKQLTRPFTDPNKILPAEVIVILGLGYVRSGDLAGEDLELFPLNNALLMQLIKLEGEDSHKPLLNQPVEHFILDHPSERILHIIIQREFHRFDRREREQRSWVDQAYGGRGYFIWSENVF